MTGWSQKLAEALDAASTGGELVMAVRWHLRGLERSGEKLPEDIRLQVQSIVQEINSTGWSAVLLVGRVIAVEQALGEFIRGSFAASD